MDDALRQALIETQREELTEYHVYTRLARREKSPANRELMERIGQQERGHYEFWAERTGERPPARRGRILWFDVLGRVLGVTFAVKRMEKGEEQAQVNYAKVVGEFPEAQAVLADEQRHEAELAAMIDEERLRYVGSTVLGLSDALVELTGALAGFTLALGKAQLIGVIGLITGIAAAMSMSASEYLSTKTERDAGKSAPKAALYTGLAYIGTVALLVLPFMLLGNALVALGITLTAALLIILGFSYYVSVVQELSFRARFLEMAGLSLGVAAISFGIGYLVRLVFNVEV